MPCSCWFINSVQKSAKVTLWKTVLLHIIVYIFILVVLTAFFTPFFLQSILVKKVSYLSSSKTIFITAKFHLV